MAHDIPAWINGALVPADKLDVHFKGLRHKAVSVFVMREGRTLLQRRALEKYHTPGLWANACCTHPHWSEDPRDCALRRLDEELGLRGLNPLHRGQVEYRADVGGGMTEHELVDIFVAEAGAGIEPLPNAEEVMDTLWLTLPELRARIAAEPESFTPWLRIYLAEHGELILG
ncbi:isopentenyl-diphosphate Delta-isomerase [Salipiger mangrovisoli]|uniref:Isopentenyl-diphosphate Delta-isomerase n=1 Tax=Salipiger mangrovisoli TaxID=2865933 RepID=A0ABR9WXD8_9RHOB|nr:isopentenyl-diphosphate delta-isomerase [Salipiger mangrovisoli]MBE9635930.1 isopentenyl-diphosphate delta-isomerase [Salipiger mangrovisoli]